MIIPWSRMDEMVGVGYIQEVKLTEMSNGLGMDLFADVYQALKPVRGT